MTIQDNQLFYEGRSYWMEYVKVNGYAFYPTEQGLTKLSRLLDINKPHLKKSINIFLEA